MSRSTRLAYLFVFLIGGCGPETASPVDWVGWWSAKSGGPQEFAVVVFRSDGTFEGSMQYGPDSSCCIAGRYESVAGSTSFEVDSTTCPSASFTGYTQVWKAEPSRVVLTKPGLEEHITRSGGDYSGPVWSFARSPESDSDRDPCGTRAGDEEPAPASPREPPV